MIRERIEQYRDIISNKRDILYSIAIIIWVATSLLKSVTFTADQQEFLYNIYHYANLIAYLLFFICVITAKYSRRELVLVLTVCVLMGIVWYVSDVRAVLSTLLVIIAAKDVNARKIFKAVLITQAVIMISVIAASQIGLISDYVVDEWTRQRHCLGFSWPLIPAAILWFVSAEYICLRDERITLPEILLIGAAGTCMYSMTDSRLAFYMLVLLLITVIIKKYIVKDKLSGNSQLQRLVVVPAAIAILSIALHTMFSWDSEFWISLNALFSDRFRLGQLAIEQYGIKAFGNVIIWVGQSTILDNTNLAYNYVDCSYLHILLTYGIVTLMLFVTAYTLIIKKAIYNKQYTLLIVLIYVMLIGIVDDSLICISRCPFIILALANQKMLGVQTDD